MKHLFCINPAAGKGNSTEAMKARIHKACKDRGLGEERDYFVKVSEKPGDITLWVRQAAQSGEAYRVYACGGDGTLNEAVCGAAAYRNVALTHVPCGSGNDFIRQFDRTAPFSSLDALLDDPKEADFDLICVNGDYSINVCSVGLDARIAMEMAGYKKIPLVRGHVAYLLSALVNTVRGVHRHYQIEIDGQVLDGSFTMVYVGSGAWYGGGFNPVPEADPTDGKLDVLLVTGVSRATVLKVIGPYKLGKFRDYPNLIRYFRTDRVKITCDTGEPVNLDGELRWAQVAEFSLAPEKLRFFYPKTVELSCKKVPSGTAGV